MHLNFIHPVTSENQFHCTRLKVCRITSSVPVQDCTRDASPDNGMASEATRTAYSVVGIACMNGFRLKNKNQRSRTCQPNGEWSGQDADYCERVPCTESIAFPPGSFFFNGQMPDSPRFETKIAVACQKGYTKVGGGAEVQCNSDGRWNWMDGKINCTRVICSDPGMPQNGFRQVRQTEQGEAYTYLSTVVFSCKLGIELSGAAFTICNENMTWTHSPPQCKWSHWLCLRSHLA